MGAEQSGGIFMPEELLELVTCDLTLYDLITVSRVCKVYNTLANTEYIWEQWYKRLCKRFNPIKFRFIYNLLKQQKEGTTKKNYWKQEVKALWSEFVGIIWIPPETRFNLSKIKDKSEKMYNRGIKRFCRVVFLELFNPSYYPFQYNQQVTGLKIHKVIGTIPFSDKNLFTHIASSVDGQETRLWVHNGFNSVVIFLYSVNSKKSFDYVSSKARKLLSSCAESISNNKKQLSFVLISDKIEVPVAEREVTTDEGINLAKELNMPFFEVSWESVLRGTERLKSYLTDYASYLDITYHS
eukprot:TRINITY_DN1875_c0_g1_i2.p1 TRINITY_DN1875_c0_g1~~TRINITY_DN1875_c0_g1_i2.p1  ORF type:complete len:304 (-),score=37.75 TRINITY_DN1875_c0_g1_i2:105-995(-)